MSLHADSMCSPYVSVTLSARTHKEQFLIRIGGVVLLKKEEYCFWFPDWPFVGQASYSILLQIALMQY